MPTKSAEKVKELVAAVLLEINNNELESIGRELGLDTTRNPQTQMFSTTYAALRVALKDPSKRQSQIDRLIAFKVSLSLGKEFGEPVDAFYNRRPDLVKILSEVDRVIDYLQSL
jgi:hypothetical protein